MSEPFLSLGAFISLATELTNRFGAITDLLQAKRKASREQEKEVARYLRGIADALAGMHDHFLRLDIPYEHGNQFKIQVGGVRSVLYKIFPSTTENEEVVGRTVATMKGLLSRAEDVDDILEKSRAELPPEAQNWLKDLRRAVGKLRGYADKLEAGVT